MTAIIIDTFRRLGLYDDTAFEAYMKRYRQAYESAYKCELEAGSITKNEYDRLVTDYVNEEIAADLVTMLVDNRKLAEKFRNAVKDSLGETAENGEKPSESKRRRIKRMSIRKLFPAFSRDIRKRIKKRYSFGGFGAIGMNIDGLGKALLLEYNGMGAEETYSETGWYKGIDGEWRFEICDSRMRYIPFGDNSFVRNNPEILKLWSYEDRRQAKGAFSPSEHLEYRELFYKLMPIKHRYAKKANTEGTVLSDIIEHEELFRNYPFLKNIRVVFSDNAEADGAYLSGVITLFTHLTEKRARGVLAHEIQHAIQEYEKFPQGSSPDFWSLHQPGKDSVELYRNTAGEVEARQTAERIDMTASERRRSMPFVGDKGTVFMGDL